MYIIFLYHVHCKIGDWFVGGATFIFFKRGLNRPGIPFKVESDPLHTCMLKMGFETGTSCLEASAVTARQANQPHSMKKTIINTSKFIIIVLN